MKLNSEIDLTVAICVFNGEKYIVETLKSLEQQSYKFFKLLIVDDGSNDNTVRIINNYLDKSDIRDYEIIRCEVNGGLAQARSIALNSTNTKYLMYFDADDIATKDMIMKMHDRLVTDPNLIVIGTYASLIDEYGKKMVGGIHVGCKSPEEALNKARLGKLFFIPTCAMFCVEEARKAGGISIKGFPPGKPRLADLCEDCDRWTRMSDFYVENKYLLVIPEELFAYRKHTNTISNNNYHMLLRMKHIKRNVKRRRAGEKDLSFIEFENSLSKKEKKTIQREAKSSVLIRDTGFALHNKKYIKGILLGIQACICDSKYVFNKIKSNLRSN